MNFGGSKPTTEAFKIEVNDPSLNAMSFTLNQDYSTPLVSERYSARGYINYGVDNLYPEHLKKMYAGSSLHASIVKFKELLTVGNGYTVDTSNLKGMEIIEVNQVTTLFDGEHSLDEALDKMAMNYWIYGAIYIKITWNADNTKIIKREVINGDKLRVGEMDKFGKIHHYYYCFDWTQSGRYNIVKIPVFDQANKLEKTQLMYFKLQSPLNNFYPAPVYQSAANWIILDGEIGNYQKSNIFNSINPSFALKFYKKPGSPEERDTILSQIQSQFAGSRNTGKAMVFFSDSKDTAPDIQPVEVSNIDKQFVVAADAIQRNVMYAHGISPILMGFKTAGALGSGTELPVAYDIANNTQIKPAQKDIESIINKLLRINGLNVNFKLNNFPLFSVSNTTPTA